MHLGRYETLLPRALIDYDYPDSTPECTLSATTPTRLRQLNEHLFTLPNSTPKKGMTQQPVCELSVEKTAPASSLTRPLLHALTGPKVPPFEFPPFYIFLPPPLPVERRSHGFLCVSTPVSKELAPHNSPLVAKLRYCRGPPADKQTLANKAMLVRWMHSLINCVYLQLKLSHIGLWRYQAVTLLSGKGLLRDVEPFCFPDSFAFPFPQPRSN